MKIIVEMTDSEFQEFSQWRKDKATYNSELFTLRSRWRAILNKIGFAIKEDLKKPGKYKLDQEHAAELMDMVIELLDNLRE